MWKPKNIRMISGEWHCFPAVEWLADRRTENPREDHRGFFLPRDAGMQMGGAKDQP
jgi:hypothetical protein